MERWWKEEILTTSRLGAHFRRVWFKLTGGSKCEVNACLKVVVSIGDELL